MLGDDFEPYIDDDRESDPTPLLVLAVAIAVAMVGAFFVAYKDW
jgi:hypothetical protein